MDHSLITNLLGWFCQGFVTVLLMVLAAKMGLFPYLLFMAAKPPTDESKTS